MLLALASANIRRTNSVNWSPSRIKNRLNDNDRLRLVIPDTLIAKGASAPVPVIEALFRRYRRSVGWTPSVDRDGWPEIYTSPDSRHRSRRPRDTVPVTLYPTIETFVYTTSNPSRS